MDTRSTRSWCAPTPRGPSAGSATPKRRRRSGPPQPPTPTPRCAKRRRRPCEPTAAGAPLPDRGRRLLRRPLRPLARAGARAAQAAGRRDLGDRPGRRLRRGRSDPASRIPDRGRRLGGVLRGLSARLAGRSRVARGGSAGALAARPAAVRELAGAVSGRRGPARGGAPPAAARHAPSPPHRHAADRLLRGSGAAPPTASSPQSARPPGSRAPGRSRWRCEPTRATCAPRASCRWSGRSPAA